MMPLLEAKWRALERVQGDMEAQTMVRGGREWQKGCPDGGVKQGMGDFQHQDAFPQSASGENFPPNLPWRQQRKRVLNTENIEGNKHFLLHLE